MHFAPKVFDFLDNQCFSSIDSIVIFPTKTCLLCSSPPGVIMTFLDPISHSRMLNFSVISAFIYFQATTLMHHHFAQKSLNKAYSACWIVLSNQIQLKHLCALTKVSAIGDIMWYYQILSCWLSADKASPFTCIHSHRLID